MGNPAEKLMSLLRLRYTANRWRYVFLENVRNETGYMPGKKRYADALAMDLWPSRGLELHGFELKVSRSDLVAELRDPEKAGAIKRYCDRWWLVIADKAILRGRVAIPEDWGILCPSKLGRSLRVYRAAPQLSPEPPSRGFLASLLSNASRIPEQTEAPVKGGGADNG